MSCMFTVAVICKGSHALISSLAAISKFLLLFTAICCFFEVPTQFVAAIYNVCVFVVVVVVVFVV